MCRVILIHEGGLGFRLNQIGISLSVIGVLLLPFSFFLFPVVSTRGVCVWVLFCLVFTVWEIHWFYQYISIWCCTAIDLRYPPTKSSLLWKVSLTAVSPFSTVSIHVFLLSPLPSDYLLWTLLIVILMFLRLSGTICFGALFLFINNSVTFDKLGAVNGLGTTITALFRYGWEGIGIYI